MVANCGATSPTARPPMVTHSCPATGTAPGRWPLPACRHPSPPQVVAPRLPVTQHHSSASIAHGTTPITNWSFLCVAAAVVHAEWARPGTGAHEQLNAAGSTTCDAPRDHITRSLGRAGKRDVSLPGKANDVPLPPARRCLCSLPPSPGLLLGGVHGKQPRGYKRSEIIIVLRQSACMFSAQAST